MRNYTINYFSQVQEKRSLPGVFPLVETSIVCQKRLCGEPLHSLSKYTINSSVSHLFETCAN